MCNEDDSGWLHLEKIKRRKMERKYLKILIVAIERYKLCNDLLVS